MANCGNTLVDVGIQLSTNPVTMLLIAVQGVHITVYSWSADGQSPAAEDSQPVVGNLQISSSPQDIIANSMQNMVISKPPQLPPPPQSTIVTPSPRQYPSMGIQLHSPFPMYPLLYQAPFPQGISYIMDHASSAAPSNTANTGSYPIISPLYPQLPPFLHLPGPGEYNQSRTHPYNYSRADSRRQNAARVSRSPYYNAASHHNHVDVSRIRDGIDVRTTVGLPTTTDRRRD